MQAKTERFEMRLDEALLAQVDAWRDQHSPAASRAEAIRQLLEAGLRVKSRDAVEFSDGEKMILMMLCDMMKQAKMKGGGADPEFVESVIVGGHYWALKWDYTGIFHGHVDRPAVVHETSNFLDMWSLIEWGYAKLTKKEKERVAAEGAPFGKNLAFRGFDGNYESQHLNVARFLVEKMGRFESFKGRDLNSHAPTLDAYRRMYPLFEKMRPNLGMGRELGSEEIIALLKAMLHPGRR
jgi:uncharacterized protein